MLNHTEMMTTRLTDNYNKDSDSNVKKMIKLMGEQANHNEQSYELMRLYHDVDIAPGPSLDAIGNNVGLKRGSRNDEEYRRLIKIRIVANWSNGDIPTLNKVLKAFMGDDFTGIQEGWKHPLGEAASIVVNIGNYAGDFEVDIIREVKAGGVGLHLATEIRGEEISLVGYSYDFPIPFPITEMFTTAEIEGVQHKSDAVIRNVVYNYDVPLPIIGMFGTESMNGKGVDVDATLNNIIFSYIVPLPICGVFYAE